MTDQEQYNEILSQHGYEFKKILGKGGFSSVFLCQSKKYNQDFAIKRGIKHRMTQSEYNTMVSLHHPNIVRLYDSFSDNNAQYLVMEYCPNGTLTQKGCLTYEKFVLYAKQILEAISLCHSLNIAHRDIKPCNIFIDQYDNIKLADFGMANSFENNSKSTEKCGSMCFSPPEMFLYKEIDPFKADIWALGITFFFMATGSIPYTYETREELKMKIIYGEIDYFDYDIDPEIRFIIKKMTDKNVILRPTPERLLNFPIFKNKIDQKQTLIGSPSFRKTIQFPSYRTKPKIGSYQSFTFQPNIHPPGIEEPKVEEKPKEKINSYKSIIYLPGTQKRCCHKPF